MAEQFLFFCTNIGNEKLLKEEIKSFYPELSPSYSRKGFLTFKNKGIHYSVGTISQLQVTFATRVGICLGKSSTLEDLKIAIGESLNNDCVIHSFSVNTDYILDTELLSFSKNTPVNEYSSEGKLVLNLISLSENEIWFGIHKVAKGITRYPNSQVDILIPNNIDIPSNGFLKLAQITQLFALKPIPRDLWLDFGCSPGGSSTFLLSKGAKVWGIDTAKPSAHLLNHPRFQFKKASVQDLAQESLPDVDINWVHVDLNLNPNQAIKEILRLCKRYNHSLKGILFTVQIVRLDFIQSIEEFEDIFYDWGFQTMISRQAPSHKREYMLIARR